MEQAEGSSSVIGTYCFYLEVRSCTGVSTTGPEGRVWSWDGRGAQRRLKPQSRFRRGPFDTEFRPGLEVLPS